MLRAFRPSHLRGLAQGLPLASASAGRPLDLVCRACMSLRGAPPRALHTPVFRLDGPVHTQRLGLLSEGRLARPPPLGHGAGVRTIHGTAPRRSASGAGGESPPKPPPPSGGATASSAGSTAGKATQILHQGTIMYEDLERLVMRQIRATNQRRFRIGFASTLLATIWFFSTFGKQIRSFFSRHTAEVAKETLQNEALQIQTRELSAAVVQFILNDPEVLSRATSFLRQAANNPETQRSLVDLAKHVFQHPETLEAVVDLAKELVPRVLQSQETLDQVAVLMAKVIVEPKVQQAVVVLLGELVQDPEVYDATVALVNRVLANEDVKKSVNDLLIDSSHKVLEDVEVIEHSKVFVAEVVTDDSVQRTGGTAIWNSLQYSFQPKLIRVLWFGLLCGLVAFIRNNARPPEAFG